MLRFQQFTAGQFWRDEYGYIEKEDEFKALFAYSPYHNIKEGTKYPPTLIMTADTDDRVVPMHSFKFAAALQRAQAGDAPILLRIETKAGHGHGTPVSEADRQRRRSLGVLGERAEDGSRIRASNLRSVDRLLCDRDDCAALAAAETTRSPAESNAVRPSHRIAREANRGILRRLVPARSRRR